MLRGRRVHYVPGWDCHGLPIELKALGGQPAGSLTPQQIRQKGKGGLKQGPPGSSGCADPSRFSAARAFAEEAVSRQKAAFQRWGVMADWDHCYHTHHGAYEAAQLKVFQEMHSKVGVRQEARLRV